MKKLITFLKVFTVLIVFFLHVPTTWGQIFEENFDYTIGSNLTDNGWTAHSGAGTQPITVTGGLFFDGYAGSNIGGAALLDNTGEDIHRTFPAQATGAVYTAFIIQTESSNSAGYFLHLGQSTIGTTYFTRVWVNATGSGLGLGSSTPASYVPITAGVPTLVVTKFDIASKVSSLFVFNSFPASEPLTPDFTFTESTSYSVGSVALRQYNASERVIVDGIRIATNWNDAVTASGGPPTVAAPTFNPAAGIYFTSQEITISTTTENATIYYTIDGSDPDETSTLYTLPVPINATTTLKARAYAEALDPSAISTAVYTFPVTVSTIANLKNAPLGGFYYLSGEVVLTFQQTFRKQKYVQDATAGLLIDDLSGVISTNYNLGDGITGIYGTLNIFGNMFQFTPFQNTGAATSSGNTIVPQVVTIGELFSNFAAYESKVVKINNASFATPGSNFVNGTVYGISDASDATGNFRTTFFDVDYIGTPIPVGTGNIIGIPNARTEGFYITSRSSADLEFIPTGPITVSTIAQLRAGQIGQEYILSGEAVLTYQEAYNNRKFVQDATAAIQIDDEDGIITTQYSLGDGITGLSGILGSHNGMLRLVPNANPGAPTSTNNVIVPEVVTIAQLNANFMNYQSELVKIMGVTFANGGATFIEGTNYPISDDSKSQGNFRTEFYDADYLYTQIPSVPTDLIVIPNTFLLQNYVTSRFASDIQPTIIVPSITVISPDGFEFWERGTTQEIKWSSQNYNGNVNIILLRGLSTTLVSNIPNTGSWMWTIPAGQAIASNYKIRVQATIGGTPSDNSDDFFSIVDEIPVPKIVINEIMYNPSNANPILNDLYYEYLELYNNGNFDVDLTDWTVSNAIVHTFAAGTILAQGQYLVLAVNADSVGTYYGISNVIKWGSGALNNSGETIELKAPDGTLMDIVAYDDESPWPTAPDGVGPSLELINPDLDNSLPENWMASPQNLGTPGAQNSAIGFQSVTVVSPNGGEIFEQGASTEITWTKINFNGLLKIELFTQDRETVVLAENIPAQNNLWPWTISGDQPVGANYKIKISDMEDGMPMDESDGTFSVVSVLVPKITVLTPNGGENWTQGTSHSITWESESFVGNVKIELFNGSSAATIVEDIAVALGTYLWAIPIDQPAGNNYSIIVSGMEPGSLSDESDAPFTISEPVVMPLLVINEIMYNSAGNDNEWIEIYNNGSAVVDLEGYYILDDDDLHPPVVFPAGYSIAPGQYFTVSLEILTPPLHFVPDFEGNALWSLGNTSDQVRLFHPSGQLVDMVHYFDSGLWPTEPDGDGPSLSLLEPGLDNSIPENWAASLQDGGTPGEVNFTEEPTLTLLTPNGGEIIEQGTTYQITWNYLNYEGTLLIELMTSVKAGAAIELGTALASDGSFAWLVEQDAGNDYIIRISDNLTGVPADESDAPFSIILPPELPEVVITEIMYNSPESDTDSLEYIELYNADVIAHNLAGWYFSKGIELILPDYELLPGAYLVVAYDATVVFNTFGVDALQWTSGGLANGGEELELKNAAGEVIDYVVFDDIAPWPFAPDSYGPSLALLDPSLDNNLGENWDSETVFVTVNAEGIPVYGTPGAANFPAPAQSYLIPSGWGGISTYLTPLQPNVADVMQLIAEDLTLMQNFNLIYFPIYNINTIGNWNNNVGYQLRAEALRYHVIHGTPVASKTVNLNTGWNGMPVLSECEVDVATLFGGNTAIIFAQEMGSDKVYWPDGGLTSLVSLIPGKAYFIKVTGPISITFPECSK